jgi:hypothetical protein
VSIILTPAQAVALAGIVGDAQGPLQLHQVGEDPDILITWGEAARPRLPMRPDGTTDPIADSSRPDAGRARPE